MPMSSGVQFYINEEENPKNGIHYNENFIERVFRDPNCDIQIYHMKKGKLLFIEPARNPKAYKSYYILSGQTRDLGSLQVFKPGDALVSHKQLAILSLHMEEDTAILVHSLGISVEDEITINKEKLSDLMEDLYRKDPYEKGHALRVFEMVKIMAIDLGFSGDQLYALNKAARFFDVGKIHMDEELLKKETPLSFDEIEIIHFHVTMSDKLIRYYYGLNTSRGILEHHEKWNGSGYPMGLMGEEISLEARLIAICDSFDAMVHKRPYREARLPDEAIEVLKNDSGIHFDSHLVTLFIENYTKGKFDNLI